MNCVKTILLAGLLFSTAASAQDWTTLDSGTTGTIRDMDSGFFEYWLVGDGGYVALSNAARTTWTPMDIGTTTDLYSVQRPASTQFWVSGANGLVRENTAGSGWHNRDLVTSERLVIYSRSSGCQNALGDNGTILRSDDGGANWQDASVPGGLNLYQVDSSGQNAGWLIAVGEQGLVLQSTDTDTDTDTDTGATWCQIDPGTTADLYTATMVTNSEYIIAGAGGVLLRTTNGGGDCNAPTPVQKTNWGSLRMPYRSSEK